VYCVLGNTEHVGLLLIDSSLALYIHVKPLGICYWYCFPWVW